MPASRILPASTAAVQLEQLRRDFVLRGAGVRRSRQVVRAVADMTLRIDQGELVAFVGANGAGKSTAIKMMTGVLRPTAGTVRVLGRDPVPERRHLAREIGVVFGQRSQLWWDLPLRESFSILAAMHRLTPRERGARLERLVEGLDLAPFLERPVRQLSLGQRMRGEAAAALLHSPALVVLDEPTIGLDLVSKEGLRRFLRTDREERGSTVFLTTHDMSDVERLCERIVVVSDGAIAYDGSLEAFRRHLGSPRELVVDLAEPLAQLPVPAPAEVVSVAAEGIRHTIRFPGTELTIPALLASIGAHAEVRDLSVHEPAIEDLVRRIGRREER